MTSMPAELELVRRCVKGDPAAREAFASSCAPIARRAATLTLLNRRGRAEPADVENLVQQTFFSLFQDGARKLGTYDGRCRLSTWLTVVTTRGALNALIADPVRKLERAVERGLLEVLSRRTGGIDLPPDIAGRAEEGGRIRSILDKLAERDRLLLQIVYQDGGSYAEAARVLGLSPNSIGPLLDRAKSRFRELVSTHAPDLMRAPEAM